MKALMCHDFYQYQGGEDIVFADECWLLEEYGHQVVRYEKNNAQISSMNKLDLVRKTFWNAETYREVRDAIQAESPDVVHCANSFPLISPSLYRAVKDEGVPMVQTLHNFRLTCPGSTLMRDGRICEDCLGKRLALSGIRHRCYQGSFTATSISALMHAFHQLRGTWNDLVDQYIVLTEHSKSIFTEVGLPVDRMSVKPNFVRQDPGYVAHHDKQDYAVFVGRLSEEKGVRVMLDAWRTLSEKIPLVIVGEGPLADIVAAATEKDSRIRWVGQQSREATMRWIAAAKFLVFPSIWYETFGRSMIEAKACGTPVIASNIGAMSLLVTHLQTGLHYEPGNVADLIRQTNFLLDDDQLRSQLAKAGREQFENEFTPLKNIQMLLSVYRKAGAKIPLADFSSEFPATAETPV